RDARCRASKSVVDHRSPPREETPIMQTPTPHAGTPRALRTSPRARGPRLADLCCSFLGQGGCPRHRLHAVAILLVLCLLTLGRGLVDAQNVSLGWDAIFQETANGVDIYTHAIALVVGLPGASYTLYMYEQ